MHSSYWSRIPVGKIIPTPCQNANFRNSGVPIARSPSLIQFLWPQIIWMKTMKSIPAKRKPTYFMSKTVIPMRPARSMANKPRERVTPTSLSTILCFLFWIRFLAPVKLCSAASTRIIVLTTFGNPFGSSPKPMPGPVWLGMA